jgi:hypothetical protein
MNILDSRILLKRSTTAGQLPTVPGSSSHTDGTWIPTDIYEGEAFLNVTDARLYTRAGSTIKEIGLQNSLVGTVQYATKTLTSAEILALGTTPITLVAAPGAGKAIFVKNVYSRINYNTTAYATVGTMFIKINGASDEIASITQQFLSSTVTRFGTFTVAYDFAFNSSNTNILENASLRINTSANPTAGNSTIDLLVEYQILDFNTIF